MCTACTWDVRASLTGFNYYCDTLNNTTRYREGILRMITNHGLSIQIARIEILSLHKLTVKHFTSLEEAYDAADVLVKTQRASPAFAGIADLWPDQIFPDMKQLDQFYYANHEGT